MDTCWIEKELKTSKFKDSRLKERLIRITTGLAKNIGSSIPMASQDWANTKATYRFLANKTFSEHEIIEGHINSTITRSEISANKILVLHDTCEFSYKQKVENIGQITRLKTNKKIDGRTQEYKPKGILMHASLAITTDAVPLGLTAIKFWNRGEFKGTTKLKRHINPTRIPIEQKESIRWIQNIKQSSDLFKNPEQLIHICDREGDIYELFSETINSKSNFIVRACVNRRNHDKSTVEKHMKTSKIKGRYQVSYRNKNDKIVTCNLKVKYKKLILRPPEGKKEYPDVEVTVIHAIEDGARNDGKDKIFWRLITNLPVNSLSDAIEKIQWYSLRWKIEVYFKILKSGCRSEYLKLREASRITKMLTINCIIGWRVYWLTMINRTGEKLPAKLVFSNTEMKILKSLIPSRNKKSKLYLHDYIIKTAQLGGYLNRNNDGPPGNSVIWKGLTKLGDILIGIESVGN
jgi:hypothetical protein